MIRKMNLVKKLHQKFVIDKIEGMYCKNSNKYPLIVELDPTAICNLSCPGCISEDIIAAGNTFSSERLLNLGRELKDIGIKGVILIGGGEPLMHPAIGKLIEYFGMNDIAVGITTNGTFIDRYMDEIAEYSSWTRVSVDAATQKTFDILRPSKTKNSKFNKVIENIKNLAKIKKGKLGFSFLIRSGIEEEGLISNIEEIYDAAKLAREIGCDYFEIKPSYNYKNDAMHTLVKYDDITLDKIKKEIQKLDSLVNDKFKILKAITLDDMLNGVNQKQEKNYNFCPVAELRTLITPTGVYVCPYWRGKAKFNFGTLQNTNFSELWNSKRKKEVLNWLNPSIHCKELHCLRHESNLEILNIMKKIQNNEKIDIVEEFDRFI